ncbi:MAG TPA: MarR family transcriptional regulator [Thermodesulfobacteriota bacterium]|nr:MarR family transcriptional regulator [Thermodesulfobacteriota bacterium]
MERISIGRELHSLNNLIRRYFEFSSHKREVETITGNNGWIIAYLSENADKDVYQKDLEGFFTITRSTASKVLRLMERKGLIQRQTVAHDARLKKLVLTKKAWKIEGLMKKDAQKMERALIRGFTDEELKTLHSHIRRMKENIASIRPASGASS